MTGTGSWPAAIGPITRRGPVPTLLTALAITPGAHIVLAGVLERRRIRPADEYTALIYGDPLLALAAALGVALAPEGPPARVRPMVTGAGLGAVAGGWLLFGLAQWADEVRSGHYTAAQAVAPTKVWHQLAVYPLAGSLVCCAGLSGLAAPPAPLLPLPPAPGPGPAVARAAGRAVLVACVAGWLALNVHDRRHPKLGHPPYDWSRLAPWAPPWPTSSHTLRQHAGQACRRRDQEERRAGGGRPALRRRLRRGEHE